MQIQKGFRGKLSTVLQPTLPFTAQITLDGNTEFDITCFGVDSQDKLSDDRYMIFYNQLSSPEKALSMNLGDNTAKIDIDLSKLPSSVVKLVLTVNTDEAHDMKSIKSGFIKLFQNENEVLTQSLDNLKFENEKAIIAIEIYKKDEWRLASVLSGFNGGLSALLAHYGGEEADGSPSTATETIQKPSEPAKISLEKKLEKEAPALVSLAKPIKVVLEKHNLTNTTARVVLVMDITGSMTSRYSNGTVQEIINRIVPLAVQFDDDGELELWYYATQFIQRANVTLENYTRAVPTNWKNIMRDLGGVNYEPNILKALINTYKNSNIPVYIAFITDGGVGSPREIKSLITEAAHFPIFWQFVGVEGRGFGVLEKLDTMDGRVVDNAGFFAMERFKNMSDETLYNNMLSEFPLWLKKASELNILRH